MVSFKRKYVHSTPLNEMHTAILASGSMSILHH